MENKIQVLRNGFTVMMMVVVWLFCCQDCCARSDIHKERAAEFIRQAEHYQRMANGYRRDALHHLRKAHSYDYWSVFYTKVGNVSKAEAQSRYAEVARENYETQMENADEADEVAGNYMKRARRLMRRYTGECDCGRKRRVF